MNVTNFQLIKFCQENNLPGKVAAVLSTFNFDEEELSETTVIDYGDCAFLINDIKYMILDDADSDSIVKDYLNAYQLELQSQLPEWIHCYVDWDAFWCDNPVYIEDIIEGLTYLDWGGNSVYYTDYV